MTRSTLSWLSVMLAGATTLAFAASSCSVADLDLTGHPCPCGTGFVCDATRNLCVTPGELTDSGPPPDDATAGPCLGDSCACTTVADCKDPAFSKCIEGKCAECASGPDTCSAGRYCLPSHLCAPGCKSNDECAALSPTAPFCNIGRHQCVNCAVDGDCTGGKKCSPAGACVDACSAGTCAGGKACCNGLCLDTQTDPLNCNACGKACGGAETACCAGACTDPLTSKTSCGQCGTSCSTTNGSPSCLAGACRWTCNAGFNHCATGNTGCETNTSSSVTQCGSCTKSCNTTVLHANGIACVASACTYATCGAGFLDCDTAKSNGCEASSSTSCPPCGANGQVCCAGNVCNPGSQCEPLPQNDGRCH
ncbi:MAG TPA: hypothetical protein VLT33_20040 [Labilithrix sp.]|nr:hypothetical protein [Labilithrix sp.]